MKNLVLGLGIIIVFALVLWQGIETFYPSPKYDDFCGKVHINRPLAIDKEFNQTDCISQGGIWKNNYCDFYSECQTKYENARQQHSKVVFIISIVTGILTLLIGYTILSIEPVGSALIGSSVWAIFYGTLINWRNFTNIWRFILLLIAFVLIIWVAIRLNTKKKKPF